MMCSVNLSSASAPSSDDDDSDGQANADQRNALPDSGMRPRDMLTKTTSVARRPPSPVQVPSSSEGSTRDGRLSSRRRSFTRSRSPAPVTMNDYGLPPRTPSPSSFFRTKLATASSRHHVLPGQLSLSFYLIPFPVTAKFSIDAKYAAESCLLLGALVYAAAKISIHGSPGSPDEWLSIGGASMFIFHG